MLESICKQNTIEVGIDESGYGACFGDMYIASVILPPDYKNNDIKDSKKLSESKRSLLYDIILKDALDYSIITVSPTEIDSSDVWRARFVGFHKCLDKLKLEFNHIIIDGNVFQSYKNIEHQCVIKGDNKYLSIAAASILAKVSRDRNIISLSEKYNLWNLENNKGYVTPDHIKLMEEHGITKLHRKSFLKNVNYLNKQYKLF